MDLLMIFRMLCGIGYRFALLHDYTSQTFSGSIRLHYVTQIFHAQREDKCGDWSFHSLQNACFALFALNVRGILQRWCCEGPGQCVKSLNDPLFVTIEAQSIANQLAACWSFAFNDILNLFGISCDAIHGDVMAQA